VVDVIYLSLTIAKLYQSFYTSNDIFTAKGALSIFGIKC
jgi:hypothetical protein